MAKKPKKAKYETRRFGNTISYDKDVESELLARSLTAVSKQFVTMAPTDCARFKTSNVKYGSDDDKISLFMTAARSIGHVDLQLAGTMVPNQVVFPVTHNALSFDLVYASMQDLQEMLKDISLDEHFAVLTIFYHAKLSDIEYIIREGKTGFDFKITSDAVKSAQVTRKYAAELSKIKTDNSKDKDGGIAKVQAKFKELYKAMEKANEFEGLMIRRERVFKSITTIMKALNDDSELARMLTKTISWNAPIALFFKLNDESKRLMPLSSYAQAMTDGSVKISNYASAVDSWNTKLGNALEQIAKKVDSATGGAKVDTNVDYLRTTFKNAYKPDFELEIPTFKGLFTNNKNDDVKIQTAKSMARAVMAQIPDFHKSYEPWSITADKAEWELSGYNVSARATAARIWLYRVLTSMTKIAYSMFRSSSITFHFPNDISKTSKEVMDIIYGMDGFAPEDINEWFLDTKEQLYDCKSLRRAYLMYKAFKQLDGDMDAFIDSEELFSQLPDWFPEVYTINDYISTFEVDEDHFFLYTRLLEDIGQIQPAINKVRTTWLKFQPRGLGIMTQGGQDVLKELVTTGLAYSQAIDFVHFCDIKGSIPLISNSLLFGAPHVVPILVSNFGWNRVANRNQLRDVKYRSVYAQGNVGIRIHAFTDTYPTVRLRDTFSIGSLTDEKRIFRGIYGSADISKYALITNVDLKDHVYPDQYLGDGSIHLRQGQ